MTHLDTGFWSGSEWTLRVADENDLTLFSLMLMGFDAPVIQSETRAAKSAANGSGQDCA